MADTTWLAAKAKEEGVYALPSGVLFKILKKGDGGVTPLVSTVCDVHYHGTFTDGTVFDSSVTRGRPSSFAPNQVIKGWTEVLQLMREGDKWEVSIPFNLAYGPQGRPPKIPPYSTLVFTIEIVKINGEGLAPVASADNIFVANFGKKYAEM